MKLYVDGGRVQPKREKTKTNKKYPAIIGLQIYILVMVDAGFPKQGSFEHFSGFLEMFKNMQNETIRWFLQKNLPINFLLIVILDKNVSMRTCPILQLKTLSSYFFGEGWGQNGWGFKNELNNGVSKQL